jgi:hypothetical protein
MAESIRTTESNRARAALVNELFRNHNRTLVRFLQSKLQNPQEAREIAQPQPKLTYPEESRRNRESRSCRWANGSKGYHSR